MDKATLGILRRAAKRLAPLIARTGRGRPCCEAHIEEVSREYIRVWPIHTPALGREDEPLRLVLPTEGLSLEVDRYECDGENAIIVRSSAARVVRLPSRPRWDGSGACLAIPAGVNGVHLMPVTSISSDVVTVESERGVDATQLDNAELLLGLRAIRRCSYDVVENVPWCDARGRRSFRTRLQARAAKQHAQHSTVISDRSRVDELVRVCCALGAQGHVSNSTNEKFQFESSSNAALKLRGHLAPGRISLSFDLLGTLYKYNARVISSSQGYSFVSRPVVLRIVGRRRQKRITVDQTFITASITHPLSGKVSAMRVLDISENGLRVDSEALRDVPMWEGLPLESVRVQVGQRSYALGEGTVRSTSGGTSFRLRRQVPSREFRAALTSLRSPELAPHTGHDFKSQLAFYRRMKMMKPYMEELAVAHLPTYVKSWGAAHAEDRVVRTFMRREGERVVASVTALRAWEGTWMGQQLLADRVREGCSPGALLMTFMDHIMPRPDCERMMFLAERSNRKMTGIHERFGQMTGTNEAMSKTQFDFWLKRSVTQHNPGVVIRPARRKDHVLIENAAIREFGREVTSALSLTAQTARLKVLGSDYASLGVERSRKIDIVEIEGHARFAFVHEFTSWGLCLSSVVNSTWVLPLLSAREPATASALLQTALSAYGPEERQPFRAFMIPSRLGQSAQAELKMRRIYELNLFVINRSGLRRYTDFLGQAYAPLTKEEETARRVG